MCGISWLIAQRYDPMASSSWGSTSFKSIPYTMGNTRSSSGCETSKPMKSWYWSEA